MTTKALAVLSGNIYNSSTVYWKEFFDKYATSSLRAMEALVRLEHPGLIVILQTFCVREEVLSSVTGGPTIWCTLTVRERDATYRPVLRVPAETFEDACWRMLTSLLDCGPSLLSGVNTPVFPKGIVPVGMQDRQSLCYVEGGCK